MIKSLLPKAQIKRMLKARTQGFKKELCCFIESLLLQVADNTESNPFELLLILSKSKGIALGRVFNPKHECLQELNAGEIIKDLVLQSLNSFPDMIKDFILGEFENEDIAEMVVKSLQGKSIFIHYGEDDELVFVEVTKKGKENLDLDEFISTLESQFNQY